MATWRPLARINGRTRVIPVGDMIDPSVLPASSGAAPTTMHADFTVAAGTQVPTTRRIRAGYGQKVRVGYDGVLSKTYG